MTFPPRLLDSPGTPSLSDAVLRGVCGAAAATILGSGTRAPRGVVIGPAGSGKSETLRLLASHSDGLGRPHSMAGGRSDIAGLAPEHLLLVDAAHLLTVEQQHQVIERAEDPDAGLVVALRPWPRTEPLARLVRLLEQSRTPVLLGRLTKEEILAALDDTHAMTPACVDQMLELTGTLSWLTLAALAALDAQPCPSEVSGDRLSAILGDRIAHRVQSLTPELRRAVEALSLGVRAAPDQASDWDDLIGHGHSEGLLHRNGEPPPIVRHAVRSTTSAQRMAEFASGIAQQLRQARSEDVDAHEWTDAVRDPAIAAALVSHGDALLTSDPRRAHDLYAAAVDCGYAEPSLAYRLARVDWALGDLEGVASHLDPVVADLAHPEHADIVDAAASMWTARGAMVTGHGLYRWAQPRRTLSVALASIVGVGVGDQQWVNVPDDEGAGPPSMASVALDTVRRGLAHALTAELGPSLAELVLGAETYTASRSVAPVPELPAVIAAVAALNVGRLDVAARVLDVAEQGGHGGPWARRRLLLWQSWVALNREHPHEAREKLAAATADAASISPRDRLLVDVLNVAIARRHGQASDLMMAWQESRHCLLRTRFDLYTFPLLGELVVCATKTGDLALVEGHLHGALAIDEALGSPPLWSVHLRWAGIQQAILLDRPESLTPHARALLAAASSNKLAAKMARAGRVWTDVMTGVVDPDSVEKAAFGLGTAGLAWDGARLAGHSASRTDDRRIAARLMACARELHPGDGQPPSVATENAEPVADAEAPAGGVLSAREREVALLVLQGKTYNEIGEAIFISPRTAEHHIARIRRRLGAGSRSELITQLRVILHDDGAGQPASGG
ncbi:MAG: hypothetical protein IPL36_11685 [Nigerium sp.]|nr:hypothetical protein [Nigerium sp.]